jgi:hypothetical protein
MRKEFTHANGRDRETRVRNTDLQKRGLQPEMYDVQIIPE